MARKKELTEAEQREKEYRLKLFDYVKTNIMGYDENQCLTKNMTLRLEGLRKGQTYANNKHESFANYSYEVLYNTFVYCKNHELDWILKNKKFDNDMHKFNYIMIVIGNNINMIYNKTKKKVEEEKRLEKIEVIDLPNYENKYVAKEQHNVSKELEALW